MKIWQPAVGVPQSRRCRDGQGERRSGLGALVLTARRQQFAEFLAVERLLSSEQVGHQRDLGKMLHRFHLHVGMMQVGAIGDDAMVRHENGVVLGNQGFERLR